MQIARRRLPIGAAIAVGAAVLLLAVAVAPGSWGTAYGQTAGTSTPEPTPTATATTVSGTTGGTVTVPNAGNVGLGVVLPAGSGTGALTVQFTPISQGTVTSTGLDAPPLPIGVPTPTSGAVATVFELNLTNAAGQTVTPSQVAFIDIDVPADVLALAGGNAANIGLERFNPATNTWEAVTCTAVSGTQLRCSTDHFSLWAVVVKTIKPGQTTPGQAGTPTPPKTGFGPTEQQSSTPYALVALLAMVVLAAGAAGGIALRRVRRPRS